MRTIRLEGHYSNVNGVQIAPGLYGIDDPALRGLGEYLLETGHVTEVKLADAPSAEQSAPPAPVDPYKGLTVAELKALAEDWEVELDGATKRDDIIAKLAAAGITPED